VNQPVRFLEVDAVLRIHSRMIAEFGGSAEVRDHGLLQSAVHMPQAQFGGKYLHEGLSKMAAAYLYHICCNHPFVDGNKRTALAAAEMFVLINDSRLTATNDELKTITWSVADGTLSKAELIDFFKQHLAANS
jgi:death on curing protein